MLLKPNLPEPWGRFHPAYLSLGQILPSLPQPRADFTQPEFDSEPGKHCQMALLNGIVDSDNNDTHPLQIIGKKVKVSL